ncbi:MAG: glutamate--tRNA ligase [Gammaproteobacteria bacterium]|nr:glutamate--tRNA ligase [Gammaproteobacteria bacterium]
MTIRTRFAPSPTGYLHVGGARTALCSYLAARQNQGQFILRIEDTDLERSTPEAIQAILDGMNWIGLDYDEGPFYQTKRFPEYLSAAQCLIKEDKAYYCDCSKARLDALRTSQQEKGEKPQYDRHCQNRNDIDLSKPHVIRFKNPQEGRVSWNDLVKGEISFANTELDDLIIVRSDGAPTYNFTVVVDDYEMKITHVIRGDDHVNNTPRQINILKAMGATLPQYAHLPMILGEDGKKLSKRHGAVSVMQYHEDGYLPQALLNYLFRLGFSHGDQEIFTRQEMMDTFRLEKVSASAAAFNISKLNWLNQYYLKTLPFAEVEQSLRHQFKLANVNSDQGPALSDLVTLMAERVHTLKELVSASLYFYTDDYPQDAAALEKHLTPETKAALTALATAFEALPVFDKESIHAAMQDTASHLNLGMGKVAMPLRVALTGGTQSPSIDATAALLGKAKTLARLARI